MGRSSQSQSAIDPKILALAGVATLLVLVFLWRFWGVIFPEKASPEIVTESALGQVVTRVVIALNEGTKPTSFDDLPKLEGQGVARIDGWGRPLTLSITQAKAKDTLAVDVRSGGADGAVGNEDDFALTAEIIKLLSGEYGVSVQTMQRPAQ